MLERYRPGRRVEEWRQKTTDERVHRSVCPARVSAGKELIVAEYARDRADRSLGEHIDFCLSVTTQSVTVNRASQSFADTTDDE